MHKTILREYIFNLDKNTIYVLLRYRASEEWWFIVKKLLPKPPKKFIKFDRELLTLSFITWKENVRYKILLFVDDE